MSPRERIAWVRAVAASRGIRIEKRGRSYRLVGPRVDVSVTQLEDVQPMDLQPAPVFLRGPGDFQPQPFTLRGSFP
jgi:hypothetical protein